jgi:2-amino-4-hydroxy-6-hydroxymethyldihydropteridine diphosphokinase
MRFCDAYLALGSNLGSRAWFLAEAVRRLAQSGVAIVGRSSIFETRAVADDPQPDYLNVVIRVDTPLSPRELLSVGLGIERAMGRVRPAGKSRAARTIDIDLILYDGWILSEVDLQLPHPGLLQRAFVRIPLAEVARRGLRHPGTGNRLDAAPMDSGVRLFARTWC